MQKTIIYCTSADTAQLTECALKDFENECGFVD